MRGPFSFGSAAARPAWLLAALACLTLVGVRLDTAPAAPGAPAAERADRDPRLLPPGARTSQHAVAGARADDPIQMEGPVADTPARMGRLAGPGLSEATPWAFPVVLAVPLRRRGRCRPREPPSVPAVHHP